MYLPISTLPEPLKVHCYLLCSLLFHLLCRMRDMYGLALLWTGCSLCTFPVGLRNPGSSALPWRPLFSIESPLLPWERPMLCLACLVLVGSHSKCPYQNLECPCQQNRPQSRVRIIPHSDIEMWLRFPSWHTWLSRRMWLSWVVICLDFSSSKMRILYAWKSRSARRPLVLLQGLSVTGGYILTCLGLVSGIFIHLDINDFLDRVLKSLSANQWWMYRNGTKPVHLMSASCVSCGSHSVTQFPYLHVAALERHYMLVL